MLEWITDNRELKLNFVSTFSWVDLAEKEDYFKQTITTKYLDFLEVRKSVEVDIPLLITEVDMQNELWNPFPSAYG